MVINFNLNPSRHYPERHRAAQLPELPDECLAGAHCAADGALPVSPEQAESPYEAMRGVKDWRDDNKSIPAASMLSIVAMAMMSGADSVKAVWRFGELLHDVALERRLRGLVVGALRVEEAEDLVVLRREDVEDT